MIIDSSALVAIVLGKAEGPVFAEAIGEAARRSISAANWLEVALVIDGRNPALSSDFDAFMAKLQIEVVPVTAEVAIRARQANREFGRGNHPARLNYGDCFAYALAKLTGEPLLFKGGDFSQTDIVPPLPA